MGNRHSGSSLNERREQDDGHGGEYCEQPKVFRKGRRHWLCDLNSDRGAPLRELRAEKKKFGLLRIGYRVSLFPSADRIRLLGRGDKDPGEDRGGRSRNNGRGKESEGPSLTLSTRVVMFEERSPESRDTACGVGFMAGEGSHWRLGGRQTGRSI